MAIFEAARRISPVLDTRIDPAVRADVVSTVGVADLMDKTCTYHRGTTGRAEAWTVAADRLARLRNPNPVWTPRDRARILGEYLHYVADCAEPPAVIGKTASILLQDLALYRVKRPLTEPVEEALKARAVEASAAESTHAAVPPAFRDAVNLTIDAILLLPPIEGAKPVEDRGPVVLVPMMSVVERGPGKLEETPRILYAGIHVLEWTTRPAASGTVVRAMVQNNLDFCVRHVIFRTGDWVGGLTTSLPQQTLRFLELPGPPSEADNVVTRFIPGDCPPDPSQQTIPLTWRVDAMPEQDGTIQFKHVKEYRPGNPPPKPVGRAFTVEYQKNDLEAIGGLELLSFQAFARDGKLRFSLKVRNRSEKKPKPLYLDFQSAAPSGVHETREVVFDLTKIPVGGERTFDGATDIRTFGETTQLRILRIRRDPLVSRTFTN